jgi:hypothetical protein
MENFLPTSDFPDYVILEYPAGGVELALALPENARKYCVTAAQYFRAGREKNARDIFTAVLKSAVSPALAAKLRFYTVPELAALAAHLLNVKFLFETRQQETVSAAAMEKSLARLQKKIH